jgi:hypothetical protein
MQPDATEDAVIDMARAAAITYGVNRTSHQWEVDANDVPDNVFLAATMDSARLYRARDSTDGTIAWGDAGAMRVGKLDPRVEALYGQVSPVVFG